ncbi:SOD3 [Cyberlindnera jadinii]|uniref:Superoxide dismutase n=1 Tax=Cyberlindnera jadinii (strain ATCC 18201 / CBS 1600 / BCRC 20928 / JCM 3617 / NBRC 0987 / NRRL Y-1542) TaxID=983966 RepID=A0A0H5BZV6_CYBJN|nr:SOD3 [Cyberlindnera jadinii]
MVSVTLPDLDYAYNALEPYISGQINEIHHKKHHQTYVNGYNAAIAGLTDAEAAGDVLKVIELQQAIKFHGGGYRNHNIFWKSLAPVSQGGGKFPTGPLADAVEKEYGTFDQLISLTNSKLASIQGSGWAWIVKNKENGSIEVVTTANQDTVGPELIPLIAIDAWEHAYYLQYQNVKADYFKAIWHVINWAEAEKRYTA